MNPGMSEDGAKVAISFIEALKREPISLALVLMNICLLVFFYFWLTSWTAQQARELDLIYADKKEVREMMARCIVPDKP
jgi:hypothetical protein